MTKQTDELREQIRDIVAPNQHIDHQNIRPYKVGFTEVGVEYVTAEIMQLIQSDRQKLLQQVDEAIPKVKDTFEIDFPARRIVVEEIRKHEVLGYNEAITELRAALDEIREGLK